MADTDTDTDTDTGTGRAATGSDSGSGPAEQPFDRLIEAIEGYVAAQGQRLVDNAGKRLGGFTEHLTDVAEQGGAGLLPAIGVRRAKGESMMHSVASAGAKKVKSAVSDAVGHSGKSGGRGASGGKFLHITETVDVGVPVSEAYNHWTNYEKFSDWAKGVRGVNRDDDTTSQWNVKVGPSSRSWRASVRTQIPDQRIAWTSEGPKGTTRGVVTFHELAERLTRIVVVVEYYPSGPIEKIGGLWRAQGRRLRLDLKHFRRHVMLAEGEEEEGWRGEIRDGEVVREPGEEGEDEHEEEEEPGEGEEFEEDEGEGEAARDEEDDEDYPDEEDYEEEDEEPYDDEEIDDESGDDESGDAEEEDDAEDEFDDEDSDEDEDDASARRPAGSRRARQRA